MKVINPELLLNAYASGHFPMSDSRDDETFTWYTARRRGIIPMDQFHVSSNVKRKIRQQRYRVRYNHDFRGVMEACADRNTTWISDILIDSYTALNKMGYAHSVELYDPEEENRLIGGLYGVALQSAFFGESLFDYEPEMHKIALFYAYQALRKGGFTLWDTQFYTDHLAQFGCMEISAKEYEKKLDAALEQEAEFSPVFPEELEL
jgi:leucyl/phenylalanyl-tRNA--protein transferase